MKVVLMGYHNPNFVNTIVYREKALGYLGHEAITSNESNYLLPGRLRDLSPQLQQWDLKRLNDHFVKLVKNKKPDICVIIGGHTLLPGSVDTIRQMGIPIGLWTTDVPLHFDNILKAAGFYTHVFCAGSEAVDIFHQHGLKNVSWMPFACDPHYHQSVSLNANDQNIYSQDIVFVGSYYPNRAKTLEAITDFDLGVWGPYWNKLSMGSPLRPKSISVKLNYHQWVKIFNACKINLVIHYQDGRTPCHQASPKLFEAMACGSFVICDRQKDVEVLFEDKKHLVFFDGERDLREKLSFYLAHPDERKAIASSGHSEVLNHHTYQHRMKQILDVLNNK